MLTIETINLPAACAATLVSFLLGFVWYGLLFNKPWLKALGIKSEDVEQSGLSMGKAVAASIIASGLTALGMAILLTNLAVNSGQPAILIGLVVWGAFSITPIFKHIFWEDRPILLFAIDSGYELVSILTVTSVLLLWPW